MEPFSEDLRLPSFEEAFCELLRDEFQIDTLNETGYNDVESLIAKKKKHRWTQEQDNFLFYLYLKFGPDWPKISFEILDRDEKSVKFRFYTVVRKIVKEKLSGRKPGGLHTQKPPTNNKKKNCRVLDKELNALSSFQDYDVELLDSSQKLEYLQQLKQRRKLIKKCIKKVQRRVQATIFKDYKLFN